MTVPEKYRRSPDKIASYDWQDFLENVGYFKLYLVGTYWNVGGVGTKFFNLTRQAIPSHANNHQADTAVSSGDITFSTEINAQMLVGGAEALFVLRHSGNAGAIRGYVYKNSELIGDLGDVSPINAGTNNCVFPVDVSKTPFSVGDILKVRVVLTGGGSFIDYNAEQAAGPSYVLLPVKAQQ